MITYSEDASGNALPEAWVVEGRTQQVVCVIQGTVAGMVIKGHTIPWKDVQRLKDLAMGLPGAVASAREANEAA